MKKVIILAAVFAFAVLTTSAVAQTPTYIGSQKCAMCHKSEKSGMQYPKWEASKHSKSVAALSSPQAADAAKAMGVATPPTDPKCLKCHSPLADKAAELKAEGVGCEVCHGAGSAYKKLAVMEDRDKAVQSGLAAFPNASAIQASCLACHESAHGTAFDFDKAWAAVKHPVPSR